MTMGDPVEVEQQQSTAQETSVTTHLATSRSSRLWRSRGAFVFGASFLLFVANGRVAPSGDNLGTRALAVSLAREGTFDLSGVLASGSSNYSTVEVSGKLRNSFPQGTAIVAAPIYFVSALASGIPPQRQAADASLERLAAALITALAVAIFYSAMTARFPAQTALLASILLAAATPALTTMSQGLWSHTGEFLFLAIAIRAAIVESSQVPAAVLSGVAAGLAIFCRPTAILLACLPLAWITGVRRRSLYFAAVAAGVLVLVVSNQVMFGSSLGQYGVLSEGKFGLELSSLASGMLGVLASPSRGLLFFFPVLVFGTVAAIFHRGSERRVALHVVVAALAVVGLVSLYENWWGGHSVGPRLLAELSLPAAILFAISWDANPCRLLRVSLAALVVYQLLVFGVLHFSPRPSEWSLDVAVDANPSVLWSIRDSQVISAITPGWRYRELGRYFDAERLASAAGDFQWRPVDLSEAANARYNSDPSCIWDSVSRALCLERLGTQPPPAFTHLKILPVESQNMVRVCRGETSRAIEVGGEIARKVDTLIQWRGPVSEEQKASPAGYIIVEFGSEKVEYLPLRLGREIFLREQLNSTLSSPDGPFYAGGVSAPDALQRQRFTLPGKNRVVTRLSIDVPRDAPDGCLYLLAASLGRIRESGA